MSSASRLLGVDHVSLVVSDPAAARYFYEDLLGLVPLPRPDLGFPGLWFDLGGGVTLHLLGVASRGPVVRPEYAGRDSHLALRVRDLEALIRRLEVAGFAIERSRSGRSAAWVRDRDGNALELVAVE